VTNAATVGTTLNVTGTTTLSNNLTVGTNTLFVDATNNRIGIGTITPTASYKLDVVGAIIASGGIYSKDVSNSYGYAFLANSGNTRPGYVQFLNDVNTPCGFVGYSNGVTKLQLGLYGDSGYTGWECLGTFDATSFSISSDYRIKENIKILDETFTVDNLRPVTYFNKKLEKEDIGLIAHEIQEVYPFLVSGEKDGEEIHFFHFLEKWSKIKIE
jgi:hypothetical protein